ncbi:hypothetical protein Tco_1334172 [Tanacetum coccineum]
MGGSYYAIPCSIISTGKDRKTPQRYPNNDPREFANSVKAITLPQDVPSTSDHHLIELENQVQRLMEAHLAPTQPTQVNKITTSCEICSGPHDTQYCMENPEQAFVEYASSRTDEAGVKWYTFKPEQNNLGDTYNPSWRKGLVSEFMASQDAKLSKFEADFKRQQGEMTNKIDTVLKAITDQITGTLPSDTVKSPILMTHLVSFARSYPTMDPRCSTQIHSSINAIIIHPKQQSDSHNRTEENKEEERDNSKNHPDSPTPPDLSISFVTEKVLKFNSLFESLGLVPPSPNAELVCTKEEDGDVMFIEIILKDDSSHKEEPEARVQEIMRRKLNPKENGNEGISNFTGRIKGMHAFVGNFTYVVDFMIVEDISSIIDPRFTNENDEVTYKMPRKIEQYNSLSNLEKEHTKLDYLRNEEDKRRGIDYVIKVKGSILTPYKAGVPFLPLVEPEVASLPLVGVGLSTSQPPPYTVEDGIGTHNPWKTVLGPITRGRRYWELLTYLLTFYKECLELGPEYVTGLDEDGEVT